jgi:hypothetical protein
MRIAKFVIQNFKSIEYVVVSNLGKSNFFFGDNGVGKSNLLQALSLWYNILVLPIYDKLSDDDQDDDKDKYVYAELLEKFGTNLRRTHAKDNIKIGVTLVLAEDEAQAFAQIINKHGNNVNIYKENEYEIEIFVELGPQVRTHSGLFLGQHFNLPPKQYADWLPRWHHISEGRALSRESRDNRDISIVKDDNLKNALFDSYLSPVWKTKSRLRIFQEYLELFGFGQLDIGLTLKSNDINLGFVKDGDRLPLENLGAGDKQIFMILGQLIFNEPVWLSVEEPEMNLSPINQKKLVDILVQFTKDPNTPLQQIFITTHSPYFEFRERFYDVFLLDGATVLHEATVQDHQDYFQYPLLPNGEDRGARINSQNQITLDEEMMTELSLHRGDLVFMLKNEYGRWEIYTEEEITSELQKIWD